MIQMKTNLNEYYFGGNSALDKAEKCLDRLRSDFLNINTVTEDFTAHPANIELKGHLCEVFGFADILLDMTITGGLEIFTIPTSLDAVTVSDNIKGSKQLTTNKYGIAFTKKAAVVPFIKFNPLAFRTMDLNAREALAIILHEIGHNFFPRDIKQSALRGTYVTTRILNYIISRREAGVDIDYNTIITTIIKEMYPINVAVTGLNTMLNYVRNNPATKNVVRILNLALEVFLIYKNEMDTLTSLIVTFQDLFSSWGRSLNSWALMSAFNICSFGWIDTIYISYDNEKFSDNFATSYGYGPDLVSGLSKCEKYIQSSRGSTVVSEIVNADKTGSLRSVMTLISLPRMILSHALMDCHPSTNARVIDQLKMLKKEFNKSDLSPAARKKILDDIERMERVHNEYFQPQKSDDAAIRFRKFISRGSIWYGGDIREIINSTRNYDWSQITKAIFNGKKDSNFRGL